MQMFGTLFDNVYADNEVLHESDGTKQYKLSEKEKYIILFR